MKRKTYGPFALARMAITLILATLPMFSRAENCPATTQPNVDSWGAFPLHYESFWYGTAALSLPLEKSGVWYGRPEHNFVRKIFFYREGFDWKQEHSPELAVSARRIDDPTSKISFSKASAAYLEDSGMSAIVLLAKFPKAGCWEIAADYGNTNLTFIVHVDSYIPVPHDGS